MHSAIKSFSIVALTAAVLTATACSSSGTVGPSAAGTSGASSAPSTSAAATSASPAATTSSTPSATPAVSFSAEPGAELTIDQIRGVLLTDKDDPGYVYDASKDDTSTDDTRDVVTGGADCQRFADATNVLTAKYLTTIRVGRQLTQSAEGREIRSGVVVLPSVDMAKVVISDVTAGLKGCKSLSLTQDDVTFSMKVAAVPQLVEDGKVGYINYTSAAGKTVLVAVELVRVGTAVSMVGLVGSATTDSTALGQMGLTLSHLSDVQAERLKTAEGAQ